MAVDLDLEVSDEDRKFVESSTADSIDKMLDNFIGDKKVACEERTKAVFEEAGGHREKADYHDGKEANFCRRPAEKCARLDGSRFEENV